MYLTYRVLANVINEEKEILNRGLIPFGFIIIIVRENGNETIVQNNISEKNRGSINITLYGLIIQRIHIYQIKK